jgi:hypothetical protein
VRIDVAKADVSQSLANDNHKGPTLVGYL